MRLTASRCVPWALCASSVLASLVACGGGGSPGASPQETRPTSAKLVPVTDCGALEAYLVDAGVERLVRQWQMGSYGVPLPAVDPGALPPDVATAGEGFDDASVPPPRDVTSTNVQEAGVDEPDLVKTDGSTLFVVRDNVLHVVKAWPADETERIARVPLTGHGGELFLVGTRLVVLTSIYEGGWGPYEPGLPGPTMEEGGASFAPPEPPGDGEWTEPFQATHVTVFDVSDPAMPVVERAFDIEGYRIGARLVDGLVYLVSTHEPGYGDPQLFDELAQLALPQAWNLSDGQRASALETVRARVRPVVASYVARAGRERFLPDLRLADGTRSDVLDCAAVFRPERAADLSLVTLLAFDPASDAAPTGEGVIASGWHVYASRQSLYLAQDSRWWWWSDDESRYAETHVHRFDLGAGQPTYIASGKVPGWVLSQFSMSEHEGHLRVATTDATWNAWSWGVVPGGGDVVAAPAETLLPLQTAEAPPRDANNVFVMDRVGTDLVVVGALRGLAPDEQIRAVRFLEDRGYVVTFRQTDPLFTIDLSVPTAPTVLGELHITGFSTYLHPLHPDHLIGVGREATETGRVLGMQLQLFDVGNPAFPLRTHQELLGAEGSWSWSEAEHDPRAFTFRDSDGVLALPVTLEEPGELREDYRHFSGLVVYRVTPAAGFEELGRISHASIAHDVWCEPGGAGDPGLGLPCEDGFGAWFASMRRSVFFDDVLYAISDVGLTVSTLGALDQPLVTIPLD
ncbi:MAG: beta-propeller domain-containing protein [Planctomycetota bacterium]